jgi:molybdopterin molybdotransferase
MPTLPTRWTASVFPGVLVKSTPHDAMISLREAQKIVLSACHPSSPDRVPVAESLGLVLAEDIVANVDQPPFTNSAMDGFAVRAEDTQAAPARLQVVGTIMAGQEPAIGIGPGEAVRIMTGALLPVGADGVCMAELSETQADGSVVVIHQPVARGAHVRYQGEDISSGDDVVESRTRLTGAYLGVLSSLGLRTVLVYPRLRIGVFSTGDELVREATNISTGKIHDSNRPALLAQLQADGWDAIDLGQIGDDESAMTEALAAGADHCDALVTSGGVSRGDGDLVKVVLEKMDPAMRSMEIAVKPAKPFAFAVLPASGIPVFGLPGNPVAALVSYELLVRPALRLMSGMINLDRPRLRAVAGEEFHRLPDGKVHYVCVRATIQPGGTIRIEKSGEQKSHILRTLAEANALAILPEGPGFITGDEVEILLLDVDRLSATPNGGSNVTSG